MPQFQTVLSQGFAETQVRVRYAETDQMGVVYHANYLVWFEVGRVEFIRQIGLSYAAMESEGAMIAVVEATARYKLPARYDDELLIRTTLAHFRGAIVRFRYSIVRAADQVVLCEGETTHIVVGRDMKRTKMPELYAARFRELLASQQQ
jgi:acyl-CoA thioester hydrolase